MHSAGHDSESHAKHSEFISGTLNHHLEACYHGNEIYIYCYQDLKSHYVKVLLSSVIQTDHDLCLGTEVGLIVAEMSFSF